MEVSCFVCLLCLHLYRMEWFFFFCSLLEIERSPSCYLINLQFIRFLSMNGHLLMPLNFSVFQVLVKILRRFYASYLSWILILSDNSRPNYFSAFSCSVLFRLCKEQTSSVFLTVKSLHWWHKYESSSSTNYFFKFSAFVFIEIHEMFQSTY